MRTHSILSYTLSVLTRTRVNTVYLETCQQCFFWHVSTLSILTHTLSILTRVNTIYLDTLIERTLPPPIGGFSIHCVPWSRAVCKRFHDEMRPSHLVVESLTHGSWSGNIFWHTHSLSWHTHSLSWHVSTLNIHTPYLGTLTLYLDTHPSILTYTISSLTYTLPIVTHTLSISTRTSLFDTHNLYLDSHTLYLDIHAPFLHSRTHYFGTRPLCTLRVPNNTTTFFLYE